MLMQHAQNPIKFLSLHTHATHAKPHQVHFPPSSLNVCQTPLIFSVVCCHYWCHNLPHYRHHKTQISNTNSANLLLGRKHRLTAEHHERKYIIHMLT